MITLADIAEYIGASCPIISVNSDGVIVFDQSAAEQQKIDAQAIVDNWKIGVNPLLLEKTKAEIEQAIQSMLDAKAKELRYVNMMSARSYAGFVNPFQVEAQKLAVWCAECWKKAGELESTGIVYTAEEVLAQMPVYVP